MYLNSDYSRGTKYVKPGLERAQVGEGYNTLTVVMIIIRWGEPVTSMDHDSVRTLTLDPIIVLARDPLIYCRIFSQKLTHTSPQHNGSKTGARISKRQVVRLSSRPQAIPSELLGRLSTEPHEYQCK